MRQASGMWQGLTKTNYDVNTKIHQLQAKCGTIKTASKINVSK
jgi:hypothetical protein